MFCRNCGVKIQEEWKVCPNCGKPLRDIEERKTDPQKDSYSSTEINTSAKKKRKWPFILVGIAMFFIILIIVSGNDEDLEESKEAATEVGENAMDSKNTENDEINSDEIEKREDEENVATVEMKGNIKIGKATDASDLTGTYIDEESDAMLKLIIEGSDATYSLSDLDGSDPQVEQNCEVTNGVISGIYYYIFTNLDGTLGISSGVGAPWGNFKKHDDTAEIDLSYDLAIIQAEEQEEYDAMSPLEKLKSKAREGNCAEEVDTSGTYTHMEDDGNYFDEVILESWFDENGLPKAMFPPRKLGDVLYNNVDYTQLEYFDFINGEDVTIYEVKRRGKDSHWYAIVLLNIQKQEGCFQGVDPISGQIVVINGDFDKILNGDSVLVFGSSMGTAADDTLNIKGAYLEIVTDRVNENSF